jgi:hypothetical protein
MALVREACAAGARLEAACAVLGVSPRTLQRWAEDGGPKADGRLAAARGRTPANKLGVACEFSALWSHFAFGIKEPLDFRRNGASGFPA